MVRIDDYLYISQHKYVKDLLDRVGLSHSKPLQIPVLASKTLSKFDRTPLVDHSFYRNIVRGLQYCTVTRSYILYIVKKLC